MEVLLKPLVFSALLFSLAGCEDYAWHQKMTVTVQTPSGEVSGSAVTSVSWSKHPFQDEGMGWSLDVRGEAVVVEVAPGRYLFAVLQGAGTTEYMGSVAAASISGQGGRVIDGTLFAEVEAKRGKAAGVIAVPRAQYPLMVTFADLNDPKSIAAVDPLHLEPRFGPGVWLKSVTLEVTDAPVTTGSIERFAFWPKLKQQVTFSGLQAWAPTQPDPLGYVTYDVLVRTK